MSHRWDVYKAIDGERDYQDAMRVGPDGRSDGRQKSVGDYLTLIRVYSAKADAAYSGNPGDGPSLQEIRKIAAICVQAMEVHGAPRRTAADQRRIDDGNRGCCAQPLAEDKDWADIKPVRFHDGTEGR